MKKYEDVEGLLKRIAEEKPDAMENIDDIDGEVFSRIEERFKKSIENRKMPRKKKLPAFIKVAAAVLAIFAVFSAAVYFADVPLIRASKDYTNTDESGKYVKTVDTLSLSPPKYVPENYVLDSIDFHDEGNRLWAEYKYIDPADSSLFILFWIDGDSIPYDKSLPRTIRELELNDMPLILTTVEDEPVINYAYFTNSRGYGISIAATVDQDTLLEIIDNIE